MARSAPKVVVVLALLALALVPATGVAERGGPGHHHHAHDGDRWSLDQRFVAFNTQSNLFEIRAGQLAQQRGAREEVRAFGAMLVADHTAQQQQLAAVAAQLNLQVPTDVSPKQARILAKLAELSGDRFDRAFLRVQIFAHLRAIAFNTHKGTDPRLSEPLAELAITGAPVLLRHLRHARVLSEGDHH